MKKLLIFVLSTILCFAAVAQQESAKKHQLKNGEKPGKEEIIEKKCKKIADKLMLDDATVAKFTPVYKKYLSELSENFDLKKLNNEIEATDSDIDKTVSDSFAKARKTIDIREKYYNEFRRFLTAKQAKAAIKIRDEKRLKGRQLHNFNRDNTTSTNKRPFGI
jgi:hypothetical protein